MPTLKVWNGSEWEYLTGGAAILQQDAEPGSPVEGDLWIDTDAEPSGSSVSGYFPDMAPSLPHANDDEFSDASLGGAWTEWDPGSKVTVTEGNYGLKLAHISSSGANNYGGVYRAIPAGDFTVITKVSHSFHTAAAGCTAGIFVAADMAAAPTTADFHTMVTGLSTNQTQMAAHLYADYQTFTSTLNTGQYGPTHAYMRMRRVSTLFSFDYSTDGVGWLRFTTFTPAYTPASIGLLINNSTAVASAVYFRFWRQSADTALDAPLLGRIL